MIHKISARLSFILFFCCANIFTAMATIIIASLDATATTAASAPAITSRNLDLSQLDSQTLKQLHNKFPEIKEDKWDRDILEKMIKWLIEENHYDTASYSSSDQLNYVLNVTHARRIHSIQVQGNKSVSDSAILQDFGIKNQTRFDMELLQEAKERVRILYKDYGFFQPVIDIEFAPTAKNDVDVTIKVKENIQTNYEQIRIDTQNSDLKNKLESITNKRIKKPYTPVSLKQLQNDIRQYLREHNFFKAEVTEPSVNLSQDLSTASVAMRIEHPETYKVEFPLIPGRVPYHEIKDAIDLNEYTSTAPNIGTEIAAKIKAYYLSLGFAKAEVHAEEEDGLDPHQIVIKLDLNEGAKIKIEKIEFSGILSKNNTFYEELLLSQASTAFANRYYVKDEFEKSLKGLIIDRRNNGYFKAKILSTRTLFNQDKNSASLFVNLDEGPLTIVENISFEGNSQISSEELTQELNLKAHGALKLNELETGIQKIKKYYQDRGFLEMTIKNEKNENDDLVIYNQDNTTADIRFRIFEGPKVIVGSIAIEGNSITKDYVILKEIEFKQNDVLTPALIEESKNRLQRVGIFGSVDIRTLEEKTMVSRRTILIKVTDRDPGLFNSGFGFTNEMDFTVRGYAGLAYRNISGLARVLSGRIDMNYNVPHIKYLERKASFGYTQPYLFDSRIKGRLNYTVAAYVSDFYALKGTLLQQGVLSLEEEISSHLTARWDLLNIGSFEDFLIRTDVTLNRVIIGSTGPTIELDYRDNPFNPTKGSFTRISTEWGSPEFASDSNIRFIRTLGSFSHSWNFYRRIVWANQVRGGYLQNLADTNNNGYVPWTQKGFILGGQSTIRGFTNAEAFPNANDLGTNFRLTTDSSMYLIKSELRFPIKGNVGGVIFYDGGSVSVTGVNLNYTYRHAAGFGVRYNTPVGPVSGEIGWKLNPLGIRGESPFALHLSIGTF